MSFNPSKKASHPEEGVGHGASNLQDGGTIASSERLCGGL